MRILLTSSVLLLLLFFFVARGNLDPDFGWHLRMGELILSSGIPMSDPFTYSMSSYFFVDHEWLTDVFFAKAYPFVGSNGLSLLFVILAACALLIQYISTQKQWIALPFLLSGLCLLPYVGIRPQIISWVFFSYVLFLLLHTIYWLRFRWTLPVLFLLWANLHGAFALGIVIVCIGVFTRWIREKRISLHDLSVVLVSIGATFGTPYHFSIWKEVWISLADSSLRWSIQEWLPALFTFNVGLVFLLPLSSTLLLRYHTRFTFVEKVLFGVLFLFAFSSSRHIPFWALCAIPLTVKGIGFLHDEIKKDADARRRFRICYNVLLGSAIGIILLQLAFIAPFVTVSPDWAYPSSAVSYLKTHPSKGNVFAEYNWGGYLIWHYPEKKVFIDGRMPSWSVATASEGESRSAFVEYTTFFNDPESIQPLLKKYTIDTVLLSPPDTAPALRSVLRFMGKEPVNISGSLEKAGFVRVYQDYQSVIYRKK